ncbi:MAG: anti-sigma factor family protein [Elusimicrobiota bacterium]
MKCSKYNHKDINQYIDNEMSEQQKKQFLKHVKECRVCREYLKEIEEITNLMRSETKDKPPDGLWSKISQSIEKRRKTSLFVKRFLVPAGAMAVLIAGVIFYNDNIKEEKLNSYLASQISYLQGENLVNEWYLKEENTDISLASFIGEQENQEIY